MRASTPACGSYRESDLHSCNTCKTTRVTWGHFTIWIQRQEQEKNPDPNYHIKTPDHLRAPKIFSFVPCFPLFLHSPCILLGQSLIQSHTLYSQFLDKETRFTFKSFIFLNLTRSPVYKAAHTGARTHRGNLKFLFCSNENCAHLMLHIYIITITVPSCHWGRGGDSATC